MAVAVHTNKISATALSLGAPKRVCDAYQLQGRYVRVLVYMAASQRPLGVGVTALSLLRRQSEYAMHTSFKADVCA